MSENASGSCRIQAAAIVVNSQRVLAPGQIVISHGRIVEVTGRLASTADVRLDDCVLLPGLINAHTHLEFSDMERPLPAGQDFPQWIRSVLAARQQAGFTESQRALVTNTAITAGLAESLAAGVVVLGDIVTAPWQPTALASPAPLDIYGSAKYLAEASRAFITPHLSKSNRCPQVIAYLEQLGLSPQRRELMAAWREQVLELERSTWPEWLIDLAFSPHAPYSTPIELCQELTRYAARTGSRMAMHILESPAEREWIDEGTGPMAEMLAQFGASDWRLPPDYTAQLCALLNQSPSVLLVHGNYLTDSELDCIARYKTMSLVYCPRTHQHFAHKPYPLRSILQRGLRLLLATDSRSTNPDLNLWQEARTALQLHAQLRPTQALAAITSSAAEALDIGHQLGSLDVGRRALLNAIQISQPLPNDAEALLDLLFQTVIHPRLIT